MYPFDQVRYAAQRGTAAFSQLGVAVLMLVILSLLAACNSPTPPPTPIPPQLAEELVFYNWAEYMPQSVLDAFSQEYGVKVTYLTYESGEEAAANLRAGQVYDVVVLENEHIPALVADGLLAEIDYRNVPNFNNISASFQDLAYDPRNEHSIPFSWGTTGLVVRSDLVEQPVTRWADLWDARYQGKIAIREGGMREPIGAALKSLGYSVNAEDPDELEAALKRLLEIRKDILFVDPYAESAVPHMLSGEAVLMVGWAEDVLWGREQNEAITYVFPEEGVLLWGDNFVIPAKSPHQPTAELFLNFVLRPEISAQIASENWYPTANEKAYSAIDPELLKDPVAFPAPENLKNAEILLPLSPEGRKRYEEIWERFMAAGS